MMGLCFFLLGFFAVCDALNRAENRYSFSLSTFDPEGKLGQVERAVEAASLGTPIVCMVSGNKDVIMAAPQVFPSPFVVEDGTNRFVQVTSRIFVAHSGIAADGRVLAAQAQRLAVEHEYTFDEEISVDLLLEELSLLYQEYTMKPGVRPFGASLVVGCNPHQGITGFYRVDPSGTIVSLGSAASYNGKLERFGVIDKLRTVQSASSESSSQSTVFDGAKVADLLLEILARQTELQYGKKESDDDRSLLSQTTIQVARLSHNGDFSVSKHGRKD